MLYSKKVHLKIYQEPKKDFYPAENKKRVQKEKIFDSLMAKQRAVCIQFANAKWKLFENLQL